MNIAERQSKYPLRRRTTAAGALLAVANLGLAGTGSIQEFEPCAPAAVAQQDNKKTTQGERQPGISMRQLAELPSLPSRDVQDFTENPRCEQPSPLIPVIAPLPEQVFTETYFQSHALTAGGVLFQNNTQLEIGTDSQWKPQVKTTLRQPNPQGGNRGRARNTRFKGSKRGN